VRVMGIYFVSSVRVDFFGGDDIQYRLSFAQARHAVKCNGTPKNVLLFVIKNNTHHDE